MLTRLSVDGFKNLLDFDCRFGPYTCIAGANAVGKSNIFDAIEFLSLLADHSFIEAAMLLRTKGEHVSEPRSLFWNNAWSDDPVIRLQAEMLVPRVVVDDFGRQAEATSTLLRYAVHLRHEPADVDARQPATLRLIHESLDHLKKGDWRTHIPWAERRPRFREQMIRGSRRGPYISTHIDPSGEAVVNIHQDGGSRGKPRPSLAARAPRTVVSTTTSSEDQTILAARREMQSWRMLALEPSAMRAPDDTFADPHVAPNGAHLPATLNRLARERGAGIFDTLSSELAMLADVRDVGVEHDPRRDILTLQARMGTGPLLPARSLSDGTLRFLTLCLAREDASFDGLLCMEEPENGIHPTKIETMADLVKSLAVDPREPVDDDNPMRQMMVNTHSPLFVQCHAPGDVLLAIPARTRRGGEIATTLKVAPLADTWRSRAGGAPVSRSAVDAFTREPDHKRILEWEDEDDEGE